MLSGLGYLVLSELPWLSTVPEAVDGQLQGEVYSNSTALFSTPEPISASVVFLFGTQCLLAIYSTPLTSLDSVCWAFWFLLCPCSLYLLSPLDTVSTGYAASLAAVFCSTFLYTSKHLRPLTYKEKGLFGSQSGRFQCIN